MRALTVNLLHGQPPSESGFDVVLVRHNIPFVVMHDCNDRTITDQFLQFWQVEGMINWLTYTITQCVAGKRKSIQKVSMVLGNQPLILQLLTSSFFQCLVVESRVGGCKKWINSYQGWNYHTQKSEIVSIFKNCS